MAHYYIQSQISPTTSESHYIMDIQVISKTESGLLELKMADKHYISGDNS